VLQQVRAGLSREPIRHSFILPGVEAGYARAVAALAYLLLPVSGLFAFLRGSSTRVRFHGLQAIFIGLLWPIALYVAALGPPGITQGVFVAGTLVWLGFLVAALLGADPRVPFLSTYLKRAAAEELRAEPRSTSGNSSP
jgi:uncharacterized membrane protein